MYKVSASNVGDQNLTDKNFQNRLNSDMEYCGFTDDLQKGFLFFLGASVNIIVNDNPLDLRQFFIDEASQQKNLAKLINLYSAPQGDFRNYGELNDYSLMQTIYTTNSLLFKISESNDSLDNYLRKIPNGSTVIGKTNLNQKLLGEFENEKYNLNSIHNLNKSFFENLGRQMKEAGLDKQKSYEAGYAYFSMMSFMDVKGTYFQIANIYNNLSPLFDALTQYPLLHLFLPKEFRANHIFSSTLQLLYKGMDSKVITHIHKFHQVLFYEPGTSRLRDAFRFNELERGLLLSQVLHNSANFRNHREAMAFRKNFLDLGEYYIASLKNKIVTRSELYSNIDLILKEKYKMDLDQQLKYGNIGDFMQFLGIVFYETCMHAMILEKVELVQ